MATIAFLGLGNMGGPMAANLVAAGHTVHGIRPCARVEGGRRRQGRQGLRHRRGGSSRRRRGDHLAAQRRDRQGLLRRGAASGEGRCAVHRHVDDLGRRCPRHPRTRPPNAGFAQLDAPVSGGVKGATAGTLAFMVGGEDDAVERARPVLEPLAGKIIHCGGSGNGQSAKLCNNMVLAVQQIAVGEAFVLAEKLGLSAQSLFDVITGATGNCWSVHTNCPVPGPGPDLTRQQRLQAGLRDRADEQGPRAWRWTR